MRCIYNGGQKQLTFRELICVVYFKNKNYMFLNGMQFLICLTTLETKLSLTSFVQRCFFVLFFLIFLRWQVTILWNHWYSLFRTSVDSTNGFQSQGGSIFTCSCLRTVILRVNSAIVHASAWSDCVCVCKFSFGIWYSFIGTTSQKWMVPIC